MPWLSEPGQYRLRLARSAPVSPLFDLMRHQVTSWPIPIFGQPIQILTVVLLKSFTPVSSVTARNAVCFGLILA